MRISRFLVAVWMPFVAGCSTSRIPSTAQDAQVVAAEAALTRRFCDAVSHVCQASLYRCDEDLPFRVWIGDGRFLAQIGGLDAQLNKRVESYYWGYFCPGGRAVIIGVVQREGGFETDELRTYLPDPWHFFLTTRPQAQGPFRVNCGGVRIDAETTAKMTAVNDIVSECARWLALAVDRGEIASGTAATLTIAQFNLDDEGTMVLVEPLHELWWVRFARDDTCHHPEALPDGYSIEDHQIESPETCAEVPRVCYTEDDAAVVKARGIVRKVTAQQPPR